jgi:hypothetical protein
LRGCTAVIALPFLIFFRSAAGSYITGFMNDFEADKSA